ncbi:hypothetical protein [Rathayibacter sp. VKM Ac-2927]|uniref:hypothetical protein n=1 Tax=Rathayibacter sp. VKM Ac-2927 TaxID=2929478 RepID=UPI001FB35812|nr:hypothetical protein [Rathayibacter sp. VKM Ac-2927]MCJ1686202.1 hypothetical protein [Rathayibacter sp. VKM Ac-2927]
MTNYRVWGRVAGHHLPQQNVKIGHIGLGPGTGLRTVGLRVENMDATFSDYSAANGPSLSLNVQSPCFMWVDVEADTARAAQHLVAANEMPLLVSILSMRSPGSGYWAEITGSFDTVNGTNGELSGPVSIFARYPESPMTFEALTTHAQDFATIAAHPPLAVASKLLARGFRLASYGGHVFEQSAALLAYFQVLEACARIVPRDVENSTADAQIQAALLTLRRKLAVGAKQHRQVEDVRTATKAFNRAELRFVSDQIDNAAQVLGLPSEWKVRAHALTALRNKRLSHPGGEATEAELLPWFPSPSAPSGAFEVARAILVATVEWFQRSDA